MAHYNCMPELIAINFYQRNCVDLKLVVPIIRFVFQLGFRIVLDQNPYGQGYGQVGSESLWAGF